MSHLIVFDFDGVIVNTFELAYSVNHDAMPDLTEDQYRRLFDGNIYDTEWQAQVRPPITSRQFFKQVVPEMMTIPPVVGIRDLVAQLSEYTTLTILSSTLAAPIHQYLALYDIDHYFDFVLGGDISPSKVVKFYMLFEKYHVKADNCIFITDTAGDVREAHQAGVMTIAVTWGYQNRDTLSKARPEHIVEHIDDLERVLSY